MLGTKKVKEVNAVATRGWKDLGTREGKDQEFDNVWQDAEGEEL